MSRALVMISANKPDDIEMELVIRMPLGDLRRLRDQLDHNWPANQLKSDISSVIRQCEERFTPKEPDNGFDTN